MSNMESSLGSTAGGDEEPWGVLQEGLASTVFRNALAGNPGLGRGIVAMRQAPNSSSKRK